MPHALLLKHGEQLSVMLVLQKVALLKRGAARS